mmetsp:Transcript_37736/g.92529  ORF Transcript_37736/g.92529 Transcript_37736/m.92529 type:complete len:214 (+) Transcript_37736:337-978(+)
MSSNRVICEKMSTREPRAFSFGSSLSSTISLPLLSIRCTSVVYSPVTASFCSAPSNRYGWLQHLRSCMTMLSSRVRLASPLLTAVKSFISSRWYHSRCMVLMPTYSLISFFGGRSFSTSLFSRRSRNGRSTLCSFDTTACCCSASSKLNHSLKSSELENTSGSRKLSSAHSSCRLFCSGVPVISSRFCDSKMRSICDKLECSFLSRCASSTMM